MIAKPLQPRPPRRTVVLAAAVPKARAVEVDRGRTAMGREMSRSDVVRAGIAMVLDHWARHDPILQEQELQARRDRYQS